MKFGRTYELTIQVEDDGTTVVVKYPLTLIIDVRRNALASANQGHFMIYNLKEDTRKKIFHDQYDTLTYRRITLRAGYESEPKLPVIFQGNVIWAYSYRQGSDWITEIEAYDGGYGIINSQISTSQPSGYTLQNLLKTVMSSMQAYNVQMGAIGNFDAERNSRGVTLMGNSWDTIQNLAGGLGQAFIDNEKVNVLDKNDYIDPPGGITKITSDTGLLETPRRSEAQLEVKMIFEPRLVIGQKVDLESLETVYNNEYAVIGIQHRGVISGATSGDMDTVLSLWEGTSKLTKVAA